MGRHQAPLPAPGMAGPLIQGAKPVAHHIVMKPVALAGLIPAPMVAAVVVNVVHLALQPLALQAVQAAVVPEEIVLNMVAIKKLKKIVKENAENIHQIVHLEFIVVVIDFRIVLMIMPF